ncbi:MAG TPA: histidine phosphatase family protein [Stellaceae bacterium]|nr:histidine phosphatase family protein [Stellaceae bacterium]
MLRPCRFYYLRHGETDWNRERRFQGQTDIPLNAQGRAQARAAAALLARCAVATICVSPLRRARETALIINEALRRPIIVIDDLKEVAFGAAEGTRMRNLLPEWRAGWVPDGAESYPGFIARALRGINAALAQEGPVLIVSHGGTYWAVEQHARLAREHAIPNCAPLRHEPPTPDHPSWRVDPVE